MRGGGAECNKLAITEYRFGDSNVRQMPGTQPKIIGDQHIPGLEGLRRKKPQEMLPRFGQRADEAWDVFGRLPQPCPLTTSDAADELTTCGLR